ncbi:MAG: hypothetical protein GY866_12725 [Proteobacteria bacterium]|nr:hypothetical protein [Pseudomonadota bacterium]
MMKFLQKYKSRRVRGAELVVTGGITLFLSNVIGYLAPVALCGYGLYRWLVRKSYKDGIVSIAAGILLLILLKGPLSFLLWLPLAAGALLLLGGAFMMIFPGQETEEGGE